jgi:hypothetical protein
MSQTSLMGMPLRPNQEPLSIVTELVFQTLADRVPGRERDWAHGLARALERAETALAYHLAALEEPEGDFDNLRIDAEQAAAAFTDRASSARRISGSTNQASWREIPDFGILRKRANELLDRLRDSCAAELRLVMDGVNTDIGGGD